MIRSVRKSPQRFLWLVVLQITCICPAQAKVLFHASFDAATADADYALGKNDARPALADTYKVTGTSDAGRWGRALDVSRSGENCTFDAAKNFNPMRGTAQMWFRITEDKQGMYHPLFGWYRPPHEPGATQRQSAIEVYVHDSTIVLGLYTPKYKGTSKAAKVEVDRWHHLEINWDCEQGDGQSVYNIFLDGTRVLHIASGGALEDGTGGKIHVGVWDYAFGYFLRGQIDELRITDQVEHATEFEPPDHPYVTPATIEYAKETHRVAIARLKQFRGEIQSLMEFAGSDGDGAAARVIRTSQETGIQVEAALAALELSLAEDDPDVQALCTAVDHAADQLSTARLPIYRISAEAAAIAAREDRRSLLFKDINDELVGDAVILNGRQLFIDNSMIEETSNARRVLDPSLTAAESLPAGTKLDRGSILFDRKDKLFRMWSVVDTANREQQRLCYAISANCIDWKKPSSKPPLTLGDQVGFYHPAARGEQWLPHPQAAFDNGIILATDRRDSFVSIHAGNAGTMTTRRFIMIGDTLVLNAKAAQGEIRVEAIDALGRVIRGFSKEECEPVTGDNIHHVVSWRGGSNCHPLQARPIKLRFHLKQCRLYSFEFQIRHNHYVPNSYRQK